MRDSTKGYLICFLAIFTWCFSEIIVKLLQGEVGPVSLSFLRFFLGGIILLVIMMFQRDIKGVSLLVTHHRWKIMLASFIGLGISNILYFLGVQLTQANIGSALYTTYPIFISIYSIFILNERTNIPSKIVGYVIGFIGVLVLMSNFQIETMFAEEYLLGDFLLLSAAALWSIHSVTGKKIFRSEQGFTNIELKYNMITMFMACIPVFILLVNLPEFSTFLHYSSVAWFYIFFMGFISTGLGLFLFFIGLRKIEVSKGISLALLKPIIVAILAFFILNEIPTIALLVSIGCVTIAVLLINRPVPTNDKKEI